MLRRTFAALLVILTVLPFTAPFALFDLAPGTPAHTTSVNDGSRALPAVAASTRMRTRFVSHRETDVSTHHALTPALYATRPATPAPRLPDRPSPSVLRI